jgi:hypothetical protein
MTVTMDLARFMTPQSAFCFGHHLWDVINLIHAGGELAHTRLCHARLLEVLRQKSFFPQAQGVDFCVTPYIHTAFGKSFRTSNSLAWWWRTGTVAHRIHLYLDMTRFCSEISCVRQGYVFGEKLTAAETALWCPAPHGYGEMENPEDIPILDSDGHIVEWDRPP